MSLGEDNNTSCGRNGCYPKYKIQVIYQTIILQHTAY